MDQLIFASLSHTQYWYEVGMLKVLATGIGYRLTFTGVVRACVNDVPKIKIGKKSKSKSGSDWSKFKTS